MKKKINELYNKFFYIKEQGWIKSVAKGSCGIGITFESLLGIQRNELEIPDYNGIEIKTKRKSYNSYVTLFSCKPEGKYYHMSEKIKDIYGYPHRKFRKYKVLNNSVYCNFRNKIGNKFYFQLKINSMDKKLLLMIYDLRGNLLEDSIYWDLGILQEKIERKLKVLAFVKADMKKSLNDECEYFKYNSMDIYVFRDFQTFIKLLEKGFIRVNFKLNIKTKGDNLGKIHDHGTSFDILENHINKLYDKYEV